LRELLSDWNNLLPVAGLALLAGTLVVFWLRRKPATPHDLEHQRRAHINRVGRIVEGQVLEIVDHSRTGNSGQPNGDKEKDGNPHIGFPNKRPSLALPNGPQKLLYYTYAISGVTYETAQDITGLEERLHLSRVAAGQTASVKYDPSNPSNSILLADDWSGLH
jgi:LPXTG-motif cell wall-anchored protein